MKKVFLGACLLGFSSLVSAYTVEDYASQYNISSNEEEVLVKESVRMDYQYPRLTNYAEVYYIDADYENEDGAFGIAFSYDILGEGKDLFLKGTYENYKVKGFEESEDVASIEFQYGFLKNQNGLLIGLGHEKYLDSEIDQNFGSVGFLISNSTNSVGLNLEARYIDVEDKEEPFYSFSADLKIYAGHGMGIVLRGEQIEDSETKEKVNNAYIGFVFAI